MDRAPKVEMLWDAGALLDVVCNAFQSDSACIAILEAPLKVRARRSNAQICMQILRNERQQCLPGNFDTTLLYDYIAIAQRGTHILPLSASSCTRSTMQTSGVNSYPAQPCLAESA